jgi:hypothetical protein
MDIQDKTIKLLNDRKGDWVDIAKRADVSYSWITKFANNKIPNSGTRTIKKVLAVLEPVT